jgi:hypothetical protein
MRAVIAILLAFFAVFGGSPSLSAQETLPQLDAHANGRRTEGPLLRRELDAHGNYGKLDDDPCGSTWNFARFSPVSC